MKIMQKMYVTNRQILSNVHGHLMETLYRSILTSDNFLIGFMQNIRKVYGYIQKLELCYFQFLCIK